MSNWIQTFTGRKFFPLAPEPADVCIEDIAHALSNVCRFTGHCREFYSVAQHSVLVAHRVADISPVVAQWALLHDASEAYICDMARPVKRQIADYRTIEQRLEQCVAQVFGIDPETMEHPAIKEADLRMLATERRDLMGPPPEAWDDIERVEPYSEIVHPWGSLYAEQRFLNTWAHLQRRRWGS